MIYFLPNEVLLEIFDHYRMDGVGRTSYFPWKWHRLAHVCRTWRHIIFASSHYLNLQLLCTYGTPVRKNLGYLPALPIVITLRGCFEDSDEDNILAALEHPDRVRVVELCVSYSLLEKMATVMQEPFPALTRLSLQSRQYLTPVLPDTFLGGCAPRLQKIYLEGIPFPAAPTLLLSARDLVDVELRDIPPEGYISPEAMVTSLAVLPRLKYLRFGPDTSFPDRIRQPPSTRTVLPALTTFHFDGFFEYLENFVAQIDTPQLDCLRIECWSVNFQFPQLCEFIDRSEKLKLYFRRMDLHIQPDIVVIELVHRGQSSFKFSIGDEGIGQVLSQISGMLSNVDRLFISSVFPRYYDGELGNGIRWLELFHPFTAVKALSVEDRLSDHVILALKDVTGARAAEVLPALELLCLEKRPVASVKEFVAARQNVGRPVTFISKVKEFKKRLGPNVREWENVPYRLPTPSLL